MTATSKMCIRDRVHEEVFTEWMSEAGLTFTPDSKVVLEEFRKVYPL